MKVLCSGWRRVCVFLCCVCFLVGVYVTQRTARTSTLKLFRSLTVSALNQQDVTFMLPNDNQTQAEVAMVPWWERDSGCQCEGQEECQTDTNPNKTSGGNGGDVGVGGTCGRRAWAAGVGQRVVAMSLYGNNSEYWIGLEDNLIQIADVYPGWVVWLYTDPRGQAGVLCPLLSRYHHMLYICDVTNLPPPLGSLTIIHHMMWRVAPLGDPLVAALMVRDSDSKVSEREGAAVREWLASGMEFHVMRDHPSHDMPVMGGMWGARWDLDPSHVHDRVHELTIMRNLMFRYAWKRFKHGLDQHILKAVLWPAMLGRVKSHDSYCCKYFPNTSPWPTQRSHGFFVGSVRYRKNKENSYVVPKTCPVRCRPPQHRDWIYC
ncbi:hypothetical protein Pcinc_022669 [Petrolisthes cinctipes]|uniref:Uncharacterized protein n=1 Tax=Petrolisthes cinctipes TaxID=88211 RepID=A0AAE1KGE6_PETCI|nr:hypothetical protein Pcinc_022669 [Petrolisthes cinctipes]